MLVDAVFA